MASAAMQDLLVDVCLRGGATCDLTGDFDGYLRAAGLDDDEREALCAHRSRLRLYRHLVRNNLEHVTWRLLSRTRARMNAHATGAFDASFARFLEDAPPTTHFLKDVPVAFFAWAEPRWRAEPDMPPYLVDLARYELAHFELASMPRIAEPRELTELALDKPVAFSSVAKLLRLGAPVHELSDDDRTPAASEPCAQRLLMYRDQQHEVQVISLGELAYATLDALVAGALLGRAVAAGSQQSGEPVTDGSLAELAELLADLAARGVLLGAQ